jgi:hypothetical protein
MSYETSKAKGKRPTPPKVPSGFRPTKPMKGMKGPRGK